MLSIRRPEGNVRSNIREIRAASRFDETPDGATVELTDEGYKLRSKAAVAEESAVEAILRAAPSSEADAMREEDLVKAANTGRTTVQKALAGLMNTGQLLRIGTGRKRSPYQFYRPEIHSAATRTLGAAERNAAGASGLRKASLDPADAE